MSRRKNPVSCGHCQVAAAVRAGHTVYRRRPSEPLMKTADALRYLAVLCSCPHKQRATSGEPTLGFEDPHKLESTLF